MGSEEHAIYSTVIEKLLYLLCNNNETKLVIELNNQFIFLTYHVTLEVACVQQLDVLDSVHEDWSTLNVLTVASFQIAHSEAAPQWEK